jgi:HPt (histidine-containing phosphotransfer) domain-containing protein
MYYITNHNDQIIAADESLLKSLHMENIDELIKEILLEKILLTKKSSTELQISTSNTTLSYTSTRSDLSSMLGSLNLIHLESIEEDSIEELNSITPTYGNEDSLITNIIQERDEETALDSSKAPLLETKDDELFDLTLPHVSTNTIDNISLDEDSQTSLTTLSSEDTSPIIIDIQAVSEDIGISNEDYKTFLNDYIDTAISLEDELQSKDENERLSAMGTLTQLADVLQLPKVNPIIQQISTVPEYELPDLVESFYQTLARLTTTEVDANTQVVTSDEVLPNIEETISIASEKEFSPTIVKGSFGKIYLEDVKPIHFDFQLESAANDLSLPVELIEEFVHDFIEQGHVETKKMLQAYKEGDLDTIQKIGHLLKGASSNLRINALSDTLYDIQFCEDSDKLEDLIERYWAHFISFEQQIDMITKD